MTFDTTTADLNFRLTNINDNSYVKSTTDQGDWIYVDFEMWFDDLTNRNWPMENIEVFIYFDPDYLEFDDTYEDVNTDAWDNVAQYTITLTEDVGPGGTDRIKLKFRDTSPNNYANDEATVYSTIRFIALCQSEGNINDLDFSTDLENCVDLEKLGSTLHYVSSDLRDGEITISDYFADFYIPGQHYDCSVLGENITVPIYCDNNFNNYWFKHFIIFDTLKLAYDSGGCPVGGCWGLSSFSCNKDTIKVSLYNSNGADPSDNEEIYHLHFTAAYDDQLWDGETNGTILTFLEDSCFSYVYYEDSPYYCDDLTEDWGYNEYSGCGDSCGEIWMDEHMADLEIVTDCGSCDYLIEDESDHATVMVRLQNNLDVGGAEDRVRILVDYGDTLTIYGTPSNVTSEDIQFDFSHPHMEDPLLLLAEQNNTNTNSCTEGGYDDLFTFNVLYGPNEMPAVQSYNGRKIALKFAATYDTDET